MVMEGVKLFWKLSVDLSPSVSHLLRFMIVMLIGDRELIRQNVTLARVRVMKQYS